MKRTITILILIAAVTSLSAQNSCGTVKDYDGNTYSTVQIGEQCWMKENLRTTHFSDGTAIPDGSDGDDKRADVKPYYYDYSGSNIPLSARGYLYNWTAAKRACPTGWHLPSDREWKSLTSYVYNQSKYVCGGYTESIAKALASTEYWERSEDNECSAGDQSRHPNNATGFSAVPAGDCAGKDFCCAGRRTIFWSSSCVGEYPCEISCPYLRYNGGGVTEGFYRKTYGFSVRCLRD